MTTQEIARFIWDNFPDKISSKVTNYQKFVTMFREVMKVHLINKVVETPTNSDSRDFNENGPWILGEKGERLKNSTIVPNVLIEEGYWNGDGSLRQSRKRSTYTTTCPLLPEEESPAHMARLGNIVHHSTSGLRPKPEFKSTELVENIVSAMQKFKRQRMTVSEILAVQRSLKRYYKLNPNMDKKKLESMMNESENKKYLVKSQEKKAGTNEFYWELTKLAVDKFAEEDFEQAEEPDNPNPSWRVDNLPSDEEDEDERGFLKRQQGSVSSHSATSSAQTSSATASDQSDLLQIYYNKFVTEIVLAMKCSGQPRMTASEICEHMLEGLPDKVLNKETIEFVINQNENKRIFVKSQEKKLGTNEFYWELSQLAEDYLAEEEMGEDSREAFYQYSSSGRTKKSKSKTARR